MIAHFYRRDADDPLPSAPLPTSVEVKIWRPAVNGFPTRGASQGENFAWWVLDQAGLFARRQFAEVTLVRDGRRIHRLIVTPRWARFPFMASGDLQIGGVWTAPEARGEGLARAAIVEAHQRLGRRLTPFWYVVDPSNEPSVRLGQACGYKLVGIGRRTRPAGISLFGQFRIDRPAPKDA